MGNEKVLLYQFHGTEAARKLQPVLLRMGIRVKSVAPEEYETPIGILAGIKGLEEAGMFSAEQRGENEVDNPESPVEISAPMMVMCGFSGKRVDELLLQMRKAGVPRIDLKAMMTPTNMYWTSRELFGELQKEHAMMTEMRTENEKKV